MKPDYTVHVRHVGDLHFELANGRAAIATEWNQGTGTWQATELFLASVASCMLAMIVEFAQRHGMEVQSGCTATITAVTREEPTRMDDIEIRCHLPVNLDDTQLRTLQRVGEQCKVHHTIAAHPNVTLTVEGE